MMRVRELSIFMDTYYSEMVHGWREENMMEQSGGDL